jgi:hypothetical protein
MDDKAWNLTNKIILPNGEEITVEDAITTTEAERAAKAAGMIKFYVTDSEGRPLKPTDFPISCDIIIEEYNEAKVKIPEELDKERLLLLFSKVAHTFGVWTPLGGRL